MDDQALLQILKNELQPALGCTEPVAVAYATAKAARLLPETPERVTLRLSRNIVKNAMGVGIPGTDAVGAEMAAALGAVAGDPDLVLEVLQKVTPEDVVRAEALLHRGGVTLELAETPDKLYIEAVCRRGEECSRVVIRGRHSDIALIEKNGQVLFSAGQTQSSAAAAVYGLKTREIWEAVHRFSMEDLAFLQTAIDVNREIAGEGLRQDYGLGLGRQLMKEGPEEEKPSIIDYAVAMTTAAADARMAGCTFPVMTLCGSGNQGLTATLSVTAAAQRLNANREGMLRALALSCLVTIHVKEQLGRLSALCGCGIGAAIGAGCAFVYLQGGDYLAVQACIQNMVADISGIICDGAKPGCSLKIATSLQSAWQCARLALHHVAAGGLDGIVDDDVEKTIHNLGTLGSAGMQTTDGVILQMMVEKKNS